MQVRIPQSGGPSNMAGMLKQAQKMQEDMAAKQAELEAAVYEVSAGGGMVSVRINGKKEIMTMDVKPDIVDPDDIETMTDIIVAAVNEAIRKVEDAANEEMAKITGQMSLPGMPGVF